MPVLDLARVTLPGATLRTAQRIPGTERQVTMAGANLFVLAAQEYGDATQWDRIARRNGLWDPVITGIVTLILPPPNPRTATGGILGA